VEAGALEDAVDGVLRRVEGEFDEVEVYGRDPDDRRAVVVRR
jgi:hypothetical protein